MKIFFAVAAALAVGSAALAQDVVISNARIIVGDGRVIEKGSVVVKDGRIVSAAAGSAPAASARAVRINGTGKTLIAGYIDAHRHLIQGPADKFLKEQAADRMRELLEAGFTTVQSGGDDNAGILELKRLVESGQIKARASWPPPECRLRP